MGKGRQTKVDADEAPPRPAGVSYGNLTAAAALLAEREQIARAVDWLADGGKLRHIEIVPAGETSLHPQMSRMIHVADGGSKTLEGDALNWLEYRFDQLCDELEELGVTLPD